MLMLYIVYSVLHLSCRQPGPCVHLNVHRFLERETNLATLAARQHRIGTSCTVLALHLPELTCV